MKRKNQLLILACCLAVICFCATASMVAAEAEPKVGQQVGNVKFPAPMSSEDAAYLGVPKGEPFTLKDIKAPYVLVEQFNTGCPHCMAQAPVLNNLYSMVQNDSALKGKLKFLAVAQGNDVSPVQMWKAFQKVPFPLIPDPNSTFGKAINFTPYPVTMVLDKSGKIAFVHVGAFESAEEVFKQIKSTLK